MTRSAYCVGIIHTYYVHPDLLEFEHSVCFLSPQQLLHSLRLYQRSPDQMKTLRTRVFELLLSSESCISFAVNLFDHQSNCTCMCVFVWTKIPQIPISKLLKKRKFSLSTSQVFSLLELRFPVIFLLFQKQLRALLNGYSLISVKSHPVGKNKMFKVSYENKLLTHFLPL